MTPDPERLRTLLALVAIGLRHEIANHLAAHPRAASIAAIPRHAPLALGDDLVTCATCEDPDGWPCPTERAHRLLWGEELDHAVATSGELDHG